MRQEGENFGKVYTNCQTWLALADVVSLAWSRTYVQLVRSLPTISNASLSLGLYTSASQTSTGGDIRSRILLEKQ